MFEVPEAKRIRRSALFSHLSSSSSPSTSAPTSPRSSPPASADTSSYPYKLDFELIEAQRTSTSAISPPKNESPSAETFSFRLFSSSAPVTAAKTTARSPSAVGSPTAENQAKEVSHITIRSPTPVDDTLSSSAGGFLAPHRPLSYYFTSTLASTFSTQSAASKLEASEAEKQAEYQDATTSGEDLLRRAKSIEWYGCRLPWRVVSVRLPRNRRSKAYGETATAALPQNASPGAIDDARDIRAQTQTKRRKCRRSKKRRILIRQKLAAAVRTQETEREKRTRRNREKKVKRKEKEKAKKKEGILGLQKEN